MADVSKTLHSALSRSVVEICHKFISFSRAVKITGSIVFDVDGQQVFLEKILLDCYACCNIK